MSQTDTNNKSETEMKIILTLTQKDFPHLFHMKEDIIDKVVHNLFKIGYQSRFPSPQKSQDILTTQTANQSLKDEIMYQLHDKTSILRNEIQQLNNNPDLNQKLDRIESIIEKLFGISYHSSKSGEVSEDLIYQILKEKYPDISHQITRKVAHHADGELVFPSGLRALLEIKNYQTSVKKEEIDKLKYDMTHNGINYAIMISLKSGIQGQKQISYQTFIHQDKNYHIVFLTHLMKDSSQLGAGLILLNRIYKLEKENQSQKEVKMDWLYSQISDHISDLSSLIDKTSILRDGFLESEKNIRNSMASFYTQLRDYQADVSNKVKSIWEKIDQDFSEMEIEIQGDNKWENLLGEIDKKSKIYKSLQKVVDIFQSQHIYPEEITGKENQYYLHSGKSTVGKMGILKTKLGVYITKPEISLVFLPKEDNTTLQFLKSVLIMCR